MSDDSWHLPKKEEYDRPAHAVAGIWSDTEGNLYKDIEIEFGRNLTIDEKREVIIHFAVGIRTKDTSHEYDIVYVNFFEPRKLYITFRWSTITKERAVFALLVELRQQFPVVKIGNVSYT